jgi:hypothetical protein
VSEVVLGTPGGGGECQLSAVVSQFAGNTRLGCLLEVSGSVGEIRGGAVTEGV